MVFQISNTSAVWRASISSNVLGACNSVTSFKLGKDLILVFLIFNSPAVWREFIFSNVSGACNFLTSFKLGKDLILVSLIFNSPTVWRDFISSNVSGACNSVTFVRLGKELIFSPLISKLSTVSKRRVGSFICFWVGVWLGVKESWGVVCFNFRGIKIGANELHFELMLGRLIGNCDCFIYIIFIFPTYHYKYKIIKTKKFVNKILQHS